MSHTANFLKSLRPKDQFPFVIPQSQETDFETLKMGHEILWWCQNRHKIATNYESITYPPRLLMITQRDWKSTFSVMAKRCDHYALVTELDAWNKVSNWKGKMDYGRRPLMHVFSQLYVITQNAARIEGYCIVKWKFGITDRLVWHIRTTSGYVRRTKEVLYWKPLIPWPCCRARSKHSVKITIMLNNVASFYHF